MFNAAYSSRSSEICYTCNTCNRLHKILSVKSFFFLFPSSHHIGMNSTYTAERRRKKGFMSSLKFWFCKLRFFMFSPYFDLCLFCPLLSKGYFLFHVLFLLPPAHKVCIHLTIKCNHITKKTPPFFFSPGLYTEHDGVI